MSIFLLLLGANATSGYFSVCDQPNQLNIQGESFSDICTGGTQRNTLQEAIGNPSSTNIGYWGTTHTFTHSDILTQMNIGYFGTTHTFTHSDILTQMNIGYFGSTHTYQSSPQISNTPLGYYGTQFGDSNGEKRITQIASFTPIGTIPSSNIFFPTLEEILYTSRTILLPTFSSPEVSQGGGSSSSRNNQNTCHRPNPLSNISHSIQNNGYTDTLRIHWDATESDTEIKVIQTYPQSHTFFLPSGSQFFEENTLEDGKQYHYFLVPYNNCGDGLYSDSLQIHYKKEAPTEPYLEIKEEKIYIRNTHSISFLQREYPKGEGLGNIQLECSLYGEKIVPLLKQDYEYHIHTSHTEHPFECYATYYDTNEAPKQTNTVINIPSKTYLSEGEAGNILSSDTSFSERYYYLTPNHEERLSYERFSLFLINTKANIILTDEDLALKILKNLGIFPPETNPIAAIRYEEFAQILPRIGERFRDDVLARIFQDFSLTQEQIYEDILFSYIVHTQLKKEDAATQASLLSCFTYQGCSRQDLYNTFREEGERQLRLSREEYKNIGIALPQSSLQGGGEGMVTWKEYIPILFQVLGKDAFYEGDYRVDEYREFVDVLERVITQDFDYYDQPLDFLGYSRFALLLLSSDMFHKIDLLTKNYLRDINEIYEDENKREELLIILGNYLR